MASPINKVSDEVLELIVDHVKGPDGTAKDVLTLLTVSKGWKVRLT
jgi:hypothetical protein